jgi:hypothetical protein
MQATDEALEQIAESIRERDVRIVALEQLVTDQSRDSGPVQLLDRPYLATLPRRVPLNPTKTQTEAETETFQPSRDAPATEPVRGSFEPPRPSGDLAAPPEQSHD